MSKILDFENSPTDIYEIIKNHAKFYETFTSVHVKNFEIENLENAINSWEDYNFEYPYLNEFRNKDLSSYEIFRATLVGLHLHSSSRTLREYNNVLKHISNFDFHDLALSLRIIIELSMMTFYMVHRLEKSLYAKDTRSFLQILIRGAFATRQPLPFPNSISRYFNNKLEKLGLKKDKTFHINDAFDYFWKNSTTVPVEVMDDNHNITKEDWALGGKNFSNKDKESFIQFYNILCEEVHPLGLLGSLPSKEDFFQEELEKGIPNYLREIDVKINFYAEKNHKIILFSQNLSENYKNFQNYLVCGKFINIYKLLEETFDKNEFNNTVKNLVGEDLYFNTNKELSKEELLNELKSIKDEN